MDSEIKNCEKPKKANQRDGFNYGISIAVVIDPVIINEIGNGVTYQRIF